MSWTDPRTWVALEVPTAAMLNTHLRDNLKAIGDPWTGYAAAWTAGGANPSIGNGVLTGSYIKAGRLVMFSINLEIGTTTTLGSGSWRWSLPAAAVESSGDVAVGQALMLDSSAGNRRLGIAYTVNPGNIVSVRMTADDALVSDSSPWAWAPGDRIRFSGAYQAAA